MSREIFNFKRIHFEDLSLGEDGQILKEVTFDFPLNCVLHIDAPTGGGKSMLLNLLAGLTQPENGLYFINDEPVSEMSFEEFVPYRLNIGFTFEYGGLIHNKTLLQNLMLPIHYHPDVADDESKERVKEWIEDFGLSKSMNLRPSDMPGSHRKLTVLLRAFVLRPELIMLDNPSMGLTEKMKQKLHNLIDRERKTGRLRHLMVTSSDRSFLEDFVDQKIVIRKGNLEFNRSPRGVAV